MNIQWKVNNRNSIMSTSEIYNLLERTGLTKEHPINYKQLCCEVVCIPLVNLNLYCVCRSDSFETKKTSWNRLSFTENSSKILILFIAQNNHCFFLHSKKKIYPIKKSMWRETLLSCTIPKKKLVRIINNNLELQPNNTNYLLSSREFLKDKAVYILEHSTLLNTVYTCFALEKLLPRGRFFTLTSLLIFGRPLREVLVRKKGKQ